MGKVLIPKQEVSNWQCLIKESWALSNKVWRCIQTTLEDNLMPRNRWQTQINSKVFLEIVLLSWCSIWPLFTFLYMMVLNYVFLWIFFLVCACVSACVYASHPRNYIFLSFPEVWRAEKRLTDIRQSIHKARSRNGGV